MINEQSLKFNKQRVDAWADLAQKLNPAIERSQAIRELNAILAELGVLVITLIKG